MNEPRPKATATEEDAFHFIVACLRENDGQRYAHFGYHLYLPRMMEHYVKTVVKFTGHYPETYFAEISPVFYAAAWNLCRRGILRPGVKAHGEQETEYTNGYSITPTGRQWLAESGRYDFVPIEPERFSRQLDSFTPKFGDGFRERGQEAIRSYGANAYLACCAMCGAAAEAILLALAIAKENDEAKVIKMYSATGGRTRVENLIIGRKPEQMQKEFRGFLSLLKYWRDSAAHGRRLGIGDNEAYTSLALLLRFAQYGSDHFSDLTS